MGLKLAVVVMVVFTKGLAGKPNINLPEKILIFEQNFDVKIAKKSCAFWVEKINFICDFSASWTKFWWCVGVGWDGEDVINADNHIFNDDLDLNSINHVHDHINHVHDLVNKFYSIRDGDVIIVSGDPDYVFYIPNEFSWLIGSGITKLYDVIMDNPGYLDDDLMDNPDLHRFDGVININGIINYDVIFYEEDVERINKRTRRKGPRENKSNMENIIHANKNENEINAHKYDHTEINLDNILKEIMDENDSECKFNDVIWRAEKEKNLI